MISVYVCNNKTSELDPKLEVILKHLDNEGLRYTPYYDVKEVMTLTKGRCHPVHGFALVAHDETVILTIYDLIMWIEANGLRRLS
jgi:hypothetical protein